MKKKETSKLKYWLLGIFLLIFTLLSVFLYKIFNADLGDSYVVSIYTESGEGHLLVFGISEEKLTKFTLPSQTLMDVARQRGEWRMSSVWKLIESEDLPKTMYSDTIIKSLKVPVNAWSSEDILSLYNFNLVNNLKFIFSANSNISFSDRIALTIFSTNVSHKDREEINLAETSYLYEAKLSDGDTGFARQTELSTRLRHYFVINTESNLIEKVEIINKSGMGNFSIDTMIKTLETVGLHILSIRDEENSDINCEIESKEKTESVDNIIKVFGCNFKKNDTGNFSMKVSVGKNFVKRF